MLQHSQIRLTTPSNAVELTGADLTLISGGQPGWGWGSNGWGGNGCGCLPPPPPCCNSWGWPNWGFGGGFGGFGGGFGGFGGGFGGLRNTILINVNSFNRRRNMW